MMLPVLQNLTDCFRFCIILFAALIIRYLFSAGVFYWYYYVIRSKSLKESRLSIIGNAPDQRLKEISYSIQSSFVFAVVGTFTYWLWQEGFTMIYTDFSAYTLLYLPVSFIIYTLLHETYYYWVHRAMHHRSVYRVVHKAHHTSIAPSPWTAFSFHPWEALIESLILPLLIVLIPIHPVILGCYLLLMTVSSVINHLDIEIYPSWLLRSPVGKLFIGATHHHYHHEEFNTNYGLYYTFWDQWMNTESEKMDL